jgi:hypothetical protein
VASSPPCPPTTTPTRRRRCRWSRPHRIRRRPKPTAAAEPEATDPTTRLTTPPAISAEQANANGAAEEYLNGQHFSRTGLIEQLGYEGYSTKVATRAVDSLHVDWYEQAVGVAKDYLNGQHFSHTGLIEQLKYDGFTAKQAAYGVRGAGL